MRLFSQLEMFFRFLTLEFFKLLNTVIQDANCKEEVVSEEKIKRCANNGLNYVHVKTSVTDQGTYSLPAVEAAISSEISHHHLHSCDAGSSRAVANIVETPEDSKPKLICPRCESEFAASDSGRFSEHRERCIDD